MAKKALRHLTSDFARAGVFQTSLLLPVIQELNRRKISYRTEEADSFVTVLYVIRHSLKEAEEVLGRIKARYRRVRL